MASLFKELHLLDRPFVPVTITIGNKEIPVHARLPSAQEQDAIDAYYMDTYAKSIAEKLEVREGHKTSERDSLRLIYESRSKNEIIDQLIPTRQTDIESRAYELAGIDREYEIRELSRLSMSNQESFAKRAQEIDDAVAITRSQAKAEIASSYELKTVEELAQLMADVNINMKATQHASQAREADVLYYSLYHAEKKVRLFESPEEVLEELRTETISGLTRIIRKAIAEYEDLPFVSPGDKEHVGQPSSQNVSAADSADGGKRTRRMKESSKQSSTPAS